MTIPVITVFGSSSPRTPQRYIALGHALGAAIAQEGWIVRSGAGADGCMGAATDGALSAGGVVEGVNLRTFVDQGLVHRQISNLRIAENMRERKRWLGEGVSAYVALPGGPGTWEELWEVAVERQINVHRCPLILCDSEDYWAGFATMLQRAADDQLLYGPASDLLTICHGVTATMAQLRLALTPAV